MLAAIFIRHVGGLQRILAAVFQTNSSVT